MPLRSPARVCGKEGSGRLRSVLPPRKNIRPVNSAASGWAARNQARLGRAGRRLDASIAAETGMYLVEPVVVPDDRARYGTGPGQVLFVSCGKAVRQYSLQNAS